MPHLSLVILVVAPMRPALGSGLVLPPRPLLPRGFSCKREQTVRCGLGSGRFAGNTCRTRSRGRRRGRRCRRRRLSLPKHVKLPLRDLLLALLLPYTQHLVRVWADGCIRVCGLCWTRLCQFEASISVPCLACESRADHTRLVRWRCAAAASAPTGAVQSTEPTRLNRETWKLEVACQDGAPAAIPRPLARAAEEHGRERSRAD